MKRTLKFTKILRKQTKLSKMNDRYLHDAIRTSQHRCRWSRSCDEFICTNTTGSGTRWNNGGLNDMRERGRRRRKSSEMTMNGRRFNQLSGLQNRLICIHTFFEWIWTAGNGREIFNWRWGRSIRPMNVLFLQGTSSGKGRGHVAVRWET